MNILFVTSTYPNEAEPYRGIYLEQQAQALKALGNKVDILHIFVGEGCTQINQNGLMVYHMGLRHRKIEKFMVHPQSRRKLWEFPWANYDVVSLHLGKLTYFCTIAEICKQLDIRVVRHFHGLNVWNEFDVPTTLKHCIYEKFALCRKMRLVSSCDAVVGVSNLVCKRVQERLKKPPVFTVYNGVDLQKFTPAAEKGNSEKFTIVCVANLISIKGQHYLLEAVHKLRDRPLHVKLIGDGVDRGALERYCLDLGIANQVQFLGALGYDEVAVHLRTSDMFIMPSVYEAFGCVFVEAMGSGILTCGCRGTGAEEIIADGINGVLVDQKNADSIADAICEAMDNPVRTRRLAEQGLMRAKEFSWAASAESLQVVYSCLCKK